MGNKRKYELRHDEKNNEVLNEGTVEMKNEDFSIVVERLSLGPSASAKGYEKIWRSRESENEIAMKFYLNSKISS